MKVKVRWLVKRLPENLDDIHVSFGFGDEQFDGFFIADPEAKLTIKNTANGYDIRYTCPVSEADVALIKRMQYQSDRDDDDYGVWISPNVWEEMDTEDENNTTFSIE